MKLHLLLAVAGVLMVATPVRAAGLTDPDYRYLEARYGVRQGGDLLGSMSAQQQSALHDMINDPLLRDYPGTRDGNVVDYLFNAYTLACEAWVQAHSSPECPPAADKTVQPGKDIADARCNACHLFGTTSAPSFFRLATDGKASEQRLARALAGGHAMSPMALQPAELKALVAYIKSLK